MKRTRRVAIAAAAILVVAIERENPDAGLLTAVLNLLRNAFVAAFTHSLEGTVNLEDVEGEKAGASEE